jgi:two-component system chemotaxis sensor kinase CheA
MAGILGEYTEIFLEESEDQIEELNSNLVLLEKDHHNQEIINDIFRAAHSLKSSAAFVGLYNLSDLAHKMENLLQKIREGSLEVNINLVNILFQCFDLIRHVISKVSEGVKIDEPFTKMIEEIEAYEKNPKAKSSSENGGNSSRESTNTKNESTKDRVRESHQRPQPGRQNSGPSEGKPGSGKDSLVLTMDDVRAIYQELDEDPDLSPYKIRVSLKQDTPMLGLRLTLIIQNLKSFGTIYKSKPSEEELENQFKGNSLYLVFLSPKSGAEIQEIMNVDMVESIQVQSLSLPNLDSRRSSGVAGRNRVGESPPLESNSVSGSDSGSSGSSVSSGSDAGESQRVAKSGKGSLARNSVNATGEDIDRPTNDAKVVLKSIKVSSDKLDQLMNNVGELVITNSGFQKIYDDLVNLFGEDSLFNELKSKIDQINRISKDLQSGIMNIRMVPIGSVFNRFSRLVRDLSLETNKKIELVLRGENTELDKKVIDAIGEPLIHLIRNSVDHGIETPEERVKKGKPEYGTVELNAYQGGSNIMVEIRDDGKGLSRKKILEKAIEKNLVSKEDASTLTDSEVFQFIFASGFSTADQVTDISGRGVGMAVVNKLIEEFKGKIIINSEEGAGTSFTLSFPQALAIIPSILVIMEEEVYAFPLSEVSETIKVNLEQITTLEGHEIINLRGEVLPIYRLNRILGLAERQEWEELPVVIVNYKSRKLGFIVDDLIGKHETVIKSLAKNYKTVPGLTGATIMGDGTIILVLDIPGLVELVGSDLVIHRREISGEPMKRVNSVRSLETVDSDFIFKSKLATNLFNSKLSDLKAKDKSKSKRDKLGKRGRQEDRIIVQREELERVGSGTGPSNGNGVAMALPQNPGYLPSGLDPENSETTSGSKREGTAVLEKQNTGSGESRTGNDSQIMDRDSKRESLSQPGNKSGITGFTSFDDEDDSPSEELPTDPDTRIGGAKPSEQDPLASGSRDKSDLFSHLESKVESEDEEHKRKASEIIRGFIDQKNQRINSVRQTKAEGIDELLNKEQLRKLETVMNTGMMNAGVVLSQLVGKEVELFVPEISLTDKDGLAREIRYSDDKFYGVKIRMNGDLNGNLLMMFSEENGKIVSRELLGEKGVGSDSGLSEDSVSVLGEISNIVCSGVINSLSNKTKTEILPSVPELIAGNFREVLDIVKPERTKFLSMHTEFSQEGNNLLGILLFLPDFDELVTIISKL